MNWTTLISLVAAVLLAAYLTFALLAPEKLP